MEKTLAATADKHYGQISGSSIVILTQCRDFRLAVAQGSQHADGMGAQFWNEITYRTRCLVKFERKSGHLDSPMPKVRHCHDHLLEQDLRIRKHFRQIHHHAARYASGVQRLNPVRL